MATNIKQLTPSKLFHPGEMLKDELDARGVTQKDFAQITGIPATQLNEIIKGKRGISADLAVIIGKALKMDAAIWTNMQMNYEMDLAKQSSKNAERIEAINVWQMLENYVPVKFFKKQSVICGNPIADIPVIKDIYGVSNIEQIAAVYSNVNYARFRKSEKLTVDKINLIGWVKLVAYKANNITVKKFDVRTELESLNALNKIFKENKNVVTKTKQLLAEYGIKLVVQSHPEKCAVDGISFWSNGNPAIGLTIRHNRIDNFAFTLMHELGHVFLHLVSNNKAEFIDLEKENTSQSKSKEEIEADDYARNALINAEAWECFMEENPFFEEAAVLSFAHKHKVNAAIVQGRFLYETANFRVRSSINKTLC
jgi:HTH-type transcriptional regulator / antitoxin HigA